MTSIELSIVDVSRGLKASFGSRPKLALGQLC